MARLPVSATVSRRLLLQVAATAPLLGLVPAAARATTVPGDAILLSLADLHSPYRRLPQLLAAVDRVIADNPGMPVAMMINGDIFERGNVAALRSEASADWHFLSALAERMPVVVNLGNHETAILDDMAAFVSRAEVAGVKVIGNLIDNRTGRFFAPSSTEIDLGGRRIGLMGLAATNPFVYREPVRETLTLLDPVAYAEAAFAPMMAGRDLAVVLSHAGVAADKAILPGLPDGTLMVGAHDHLTLDHAAGATRYFHGGSWGNSLRLVGVRLTDGAPDLQVADHPIAVDDPADGDLADRIDGVLAEHLTEADREILADLPRGYDLPESILLATDAIRAAAAADVAFLGHTTFGTGLSAGPLSRYDFNAYIRFDGDIQVAEVSGETLAGIFGRANQHLATRLEDRTGDFVHARSLDIDPTATYRVAVNGWTAMNQGAYLGTSDLAFQPVEGLMLKAVVAEALAGM